MDTYHREFPCLFPSDVDSWGAASLSPGHRGPLSPNHLLSRGPRAANHPSLPSTEIGLVEANSGVRSRDAWGFYFNYITPRGTGALELGWSYSRLM